MPIELFSPLSIIAGGITAFILGSLWYSPLFFMNAWLDGRNIKKEAAPKRPSYYMWLVMVHTLLAGTAISGVLAFVLDLLALETVTRMVQMSIILSLGFIGLRNFMEMLYSMPETYWSIRAQKKFFIDTGYYVCMFTLSTLVMYYVSKCFNY